MIGAHITLRNCAIVRRGLFLDMRAVFSPLVPAIVWAFFLPLQTRYFLWQPELGGGAVEYGVVSIYLLPLLCFGWFIASSFLWGDFGRKASDVSQSIDLKWVGVSVLAIVCLFVSCYFSLDWRLSLGFLGNFLTASLFVVILLDRRVVLEPVLLAFILGLLPSVFLGGFQVVSGMSPASTFFGLASRDAERLGDAVLLLGDVRILRAYGFFPHPNIFGGYLAVAACASIFLWQLKRKPLYLVIFSALSFGLLLTASRSAILGTFFGVSTLLFLVSRFGVHRALTTLFTLLATSALFASLFTVPSALSMVRGGGVLEQKSVSERVVGILDLPILSPTRLLFGVGPGNTVVALHQRHLTWEAWQLQPPHVMPLILLLELGLLGFAALFVGFVYMFIVFSRRLLEEDRLYLSWFHVFIPIAFFDHYLVTLYSGLALLFFVCAFVWRGRMI